MKLIKGKCLLPCARFEYKSTNVPKEKNKFVLLRIAYYRIEQSWYVAIAMFNCSYETISANLVFGFLQFPDSFKVTKNKRRFVNKRLPSMRRVSSILQSTCWRQIVARIEVKADQDQISLGCVYLAGCSNPSAQRTDKTFSFSSLSIDDILFTN